MLCMFSNILYYDYRNNIADNLIEFMRVRGYSRLSLSKLTGLSRNTVEDIFNGKSNDRKIYDYQIIQINQTFELPPDYFLNSQKTQLNVLDNVDSEKTRLVKDLFDGLENVLDIFSMYLK